MGEFMKDLPRIESRLDGERHRARLWSNIGSDVWSATRRIAGQPTTSAVTILTLALAIGVATAVFSVVDQFILRPPPFLHADRLVNVWQQTAPGRSGGSGLTAEKIFAWQQQPAVFERLEAYIGATFDLSESVEPKQVVGRIVSLGLFEMLGIKMHLGRSFAAGDGAPGSEKVVILSHEFWSARFGGSPDALGSRIVLNDEPYTIIGVLRAGTTLLTDDEPVWLPFDLTTSRTGAPSRRFFGIGRLRTALDVTQARSIADSIAASLDKSMPVPGTWHLGIDEKTSALLAPAARQTLFVLLGAVTVLLVIACVNTTSVALGQAVRRERELQLRSAMGAGRWRLLRESLVEILLLAAAAGIAATAIAYISLGVLLAAAPDGMVSMMTRRVEIDLRVLAVLGAVTLIAGLSAGLLTGLRSSRVDVSSALRDGTRASERRLSFTSPVGCLVVVEVALAMVLLVGSSLLSRTLLAYYSIEPGFHVDELMTVDVALPSHRYPDERARREFFNALDTALRGQAGIEATAYAWGLPPAAGSLSAQLQAEGADPLPADLEYFANAISPAYFETTGTPLLAGRAFTPDDGNDHVILSASFARLLWGNEWGVGKRIRESPDGAWQTVIGVARDVESRWDSRQPSNLQMYVPLPPAPSISSPAPARRSYIRQMLIVRASEPAGVPAAVRTQVRNLDPVLPLGTFRAGSDIYSEPFAHQHFILTVMGGLAGVALLLAAIGIFGVLSQAVTFRQREIGIRLALGAGRRRVVRMLVGQSLALAAAGVAIGTGASLAGVRTLEGLLFGVAPFDAISYILVVTVILAAALLACLWPTARALAVDPAEVLRSV
jgi:predicted permease